MIFSLVKIYYRVQEKRGLIHGLVVCLGGRVNIVAHGVVFHQFVSRNSFDVLNKGNLSQGAVLAQRQAGQGRVIIEIVGGDASRENVENSNSHQPVVNIVALMVRAVSIEALHIRTEGLGLQIKRHRATTTLVSNPAIYIHV
jgi:hypothetical protein